MTAQRPINYASMLLSFLAVLDTWLQTDPYVTGGVWVDIDVQPYRPAVGAWMPTPRPEGESDPIARI